MLLGAQAGIEAIVVFLEVQVFDEFNKTWTFKAFPIFNVLDTTESYKQFVDKPLKELINELKVHYRQHNKLARISVVYQKQGTSLCPFTYMFTFKDYDDLLDKLMNEIKVARSYASQTSEVNGTINIII